MSHRYLITCSGCSQPLSVTTGQAGEVTRCQCGAETAIPTLRELQQMPVDRTAVTSDRVDRWDPRRGTVFVIGMVAMLAAVLVLMRVTPQRRALETAKPEIPEMRVDVKDLQPLEAWEGWLFFRNQTLDYRQTPQYLQNRQKDRELAIYQGIAYGFLALGAIAVGLSFLWRPGSARRPPPR